MRIQLEVADITVSARISISENNSERSTDAVPSNIERLQAAQHRPYRGPPTRCLCAVKVVSDLLPTWLSPHGQWQP